MTDEAWLPCPGYGDLYEVSSAGRIRSERGILTGVKDSGGYPTARLYQQGIGKRFKIHRLVCEAFNGPCPEGHECGHLDGNPENAAAANLAWITRSENNRQAVAQGTHRGFQNGTGYRYNSWRPISTAPTDGTEVLVYVRPKVIRLGWFFAPSSRTRGWRDENGKPIDPLHWMPMPDAPVP